MQLPQLHWTSKHCKWKIKNGQLHTTWLQNHNMLGWCGAPKGDFKGSIWLGHKSLSSGAGGEWNEPTAPDVRLLWCNQIDISNSAFGVSSSSWSIFKQQLQSSNSTTNLAWISDCIEI